MRVVTDKRLRRSGRQSVPLQTTSVNAVQWCHMLHPTTRLP